MIPSLLWKFPEGMQYVEWLPERMSGRSEAHEDLPVVRKKVVFLLPGWLSQGKPDTLLLHC